MTQLDAMLSAGAAGLFTWGVTALGAALVFCTRRASPAVLDRMLGFGAGVMLASAFWSLLAPGLEQARQLGQSPAVTAALGLFAGAGCIQLGDRLWARARQGAAARRCQLLVAAITLHNIPEGLAVGVAFGALAAGSAGATLGGAWLLALGIGLQNFPEGAAVSLPLRREGMGRRAAFGWGQLSGFVEPLSALLGALLAGALSAALPFLMCFAAGAMLWVLITELFPACGASPARLPAAWWAMAGFAAMAALDLSLG